MACGQVALGLSTGRVQPGVIPAPSPPAATGQEQSTGAEALVATAAHCSLPMGKEKEAGQREPVMLARNSHGEGIRGVF